VSIVKVIKQSLEDSFLCLKITAIPSKNLPLRSNELIKESKKKKLCATRLERLKRREDAKVVGKTYQVSLWSFCHFC